MARQGTKRQVAIEIMTENKDKPSSVVIPMIAEANGLTPSAARAYYKHISEKGWAPGKLEPGRAKKAKAPAKAKEKAAPKVDKKKADKVKASNLETIKKVAAKRKAKEAAAKGAEVPNLDTDEDVTAAVDEILAS